MFSIRVLAFCIAIFKTISPFPKPYRQFQLCIAIVKTITPFSKPYRQFGVKLYCLSACSRPPEMITEIVLAEHFLHASLHHTSELWIHCATLGPTLGNQKMKSAIWTQGPGTQRPCAGHPSSLLNRLLYPRLRQQPGPRPDRVPGRTGLV